MPGVLKAKVNGTWVPITGPGHGVPAGGVTGDVMIKNSASPFDARWGNTLTTSLLSTAGLSNGAHPGHSSSPGLWKGTDPGTKYMLLGFGNDTYLNTDGGDWGLRVDNATYLQSDRVNGTLFTSRRFDFGGNNGPYWRDWGGGWYMQDSTWIRASNNKNIFTGGEIRTGAKFSFGPGGYVFTNETDTDTGIYYNSDGNWQLRANGVAVASIIPSWFTIGTSATVSGTLYAGNIGDTGTSPADMYVTNWYRCRSTGGIYWQHGAGLQSVAPGWLNMYAANLSMENYIIRLRAYSDDNHKIQYYNGTPPGSGEASNGPLIQGYSSVWLHNVSANKPFYLASSGNTFIAAGQSYTTFSSIEFKEHIEYLDPNVCLEQVRRWRPCEFDIKSDPDYPNNPVVHAEGFIAEHHYEVTPSMVTVCDEHSERPGWTNAIDYARGVVRLSGAVQALAARIEQLERKAA